MIPDFLQDILEKIKKEWRETLKNFGVKLKEKPTVMTEQNPHYEVNLVPDVKRKMLKAMRFRNIMLFVCIIVVAVAVGIVAIMTTVWEGQNITMANQDDRIETMSKKINGFSSISEFLTIQNQLGNIENINQNKKVLSRIFSILPVILPEGPDTISISELSINLAENSLRFDAQADAKVSPYIDYRVLESFKKGVTLMKYDYGRYVTADNEEIPTRCMVETDEAGNTLVEEDKSGAVVNKYIYAYWLKGKKGCDPSRDDYSDEDNEDEEEVLVTVDNTANQSVVNSMENAGERTSSDSAEYAKFKDRLAAMDSDYARTLAYAQLSGGAKIENVDVIKIYRSPKFSEWFNKGYMDLNGVISGIEHFDSECISYDGSNNNGLVKWTSTNDDCMLSREDPIIRDSSNGRNSDGNLVLRFSATLTLDPKIFEFKNKHIMAISPSGQNVTDSYRQIEGMFEERAADCNDSDVVCTTAATEGNE